MQKHRVWNVAIVVGALLCAATGAAAQQSVPTDASDWPEYGNGKYGYTICYPAHLLKPQREADNGDGRVFTGKNGMTMRVWGAGNILDWTVTSAKNWRMGYMAKDGVDFTYMRQGKNFFVLSGMRKGRIVYHKSILENDTWRAVEFNYKPADRAIWDPVVTRVGTCLNAM